MALKSYPKIVGSHNRRNLQEFLASQYDKEGNE